MADPENRTWRRACAAADLAAGAPVPVELEGRPVVLWRDKEGLPAAVENRCVHVPVPLSDGVCASGKLRCKYHGLEYNRYGQVIGVFGHPLDDSRRVDAWPAAEKNGAIWVWFGEPEDADEALIPG